MIVVTAKLQVIQVQVASGCLTRTAAGRNLARGREGVIVEILLGGLELVERHPDARGFQAREKLLQPLASHAVGDVLVGAACPTQKRQVRAGGIRINTLPEHLEEVLLPVLERVRQGGARLFK